MQKRVHRRFAVHQHACIMFSLPAGDVVFTSVGYQGVAIDAGVPFDARRGLIPNTHGRVDTTLRPGLYCSGWIKTGPTGTRAFSRADVGALAIVTFLSFHRDIYRRSKAQGLNFQSPSPNVALTQR